MSTLKETIVVEQFIRVLGRENYRQLCLLALENLFTKIKKEDMTPSNVTQFLGLIAQATVLVRYLTRDYDNELAAHRRQFANHLETETIKFMLDAQKQAVAHH